MNGQTIRPQEGPQEQFLSTTADIALYGGAAGGGKTFGLLLEGLRHIDVLGFGAVIFRRVSTQIRNEGGLWDESETIYPMVGANPKESSLEWMFPRDIKIKFAHMEHENDRFAWDGSQIPYIGFDELTHFTEKQFFYMLSRNRSTCGIKPYIRATCNPSSKSWVKRFIAWWIGPDGFIIPERSGVIRWWCRIEGEFHWADTRQELIDTFGEDTLPLSFTFILSRIYDNKILLAKDPGYLAKLKGLSKVERMGLLDGNWNASESIGDYFQKEWFEFVEHFPKLKRVVRFWDRASTKPNPNNPDPDWTVGVLMGITTGNTIFIIDVVRFREGPKEVRARIKNTASRDGKNCEIILAKDPGQAGEVEAMDLVSYLIGYNVRAIKETGDKETRAKPFSAQVEGGNVKLVVGDWNDDYVTEHENFPHGDHDDQVDASSGAFAALIGNQSGVFTEAMAKSNVEERYDSDHGQRRDNPQKMQW